MGDKHTGCVGADCPHCSRYAGLLATEPEGAERFAVALGFRVKRRADPSKPRAEKGVPP